MTYSALFSVEGKTALITGGASGIGRACAIAMAEGGANVGIIDFNQSLGIKTLASLQALGVKAHFMAGDVSDETQVQSMTEAMVDHFGRLDIAINSAGIAPVADRLGQTKTQWDQVLDINLGGVWLCAQAQAMQMVRQ